MFRKRCLPTVGSDGKGAAVKWSTCSIISGERGNTVMEGCERAARCKAPLTGRPGRQGAGSGSGICWSISLLLLAYDAVASSGLFQVDPGKGAASEWMNSGPVGRAQGCAARRCRHDCRWDGQWRVAGWRLGDGGQETVLKDEPTGTAARRACSLGLEVGQPALAQRWKLSEFHLYHQSSWVDIMIYITI